MGSHELSITNRITAEAGGNGIRTMEHGTTICAISSNRGVPSTVREYKYGREMPSMKLLRTSSVKNQATTLQELKAVQNRFERQMENNERKVAMEICDR